MLICMVCCWLALHKRKDCLDYATKSLELISWACIDWNKLHSSPYETRKLLGNYSEIMDLIKKALPLFFKFELLIETRCDFPHHLVSLLHQMGSESFVHVLLCATYMARRHCRLIVNVQVLDWNWILVCAAVGPRGSYLLTGAPANISINHTSTVISNSVSAHLCQ